MNIEAPNELHHGILLQLNHDLQRAVMGLRNQNAQLSAQLVSAHSKVRELEKELSAYREIEDEHK